MVIGINSQSLVAIGLLGNQLETALYRENTPPRIDKILGIVGKNRLQSLVRRIGKLIFEHPER